MSLCKSESEEMDFSAFTAWDFRSIHPMIDNGARREAAQQITLLRINSIMSHLICHILETKKEKAFASGGGSGRQKK